MATSNENASSAPSPNSGESKWLVRGFVAALWVACAISLSPNMVDPDLWGHVQYGQDVIAAGKLPETATHTYTSPDYRWVNHENLSELALATAYATVGARGMLVGKCLLGLIVIGLIMWNARRQGVGPVTGTAWVLLVSMSLTAFWAMRPQLATFLSLTAMIVTLDAAFAPWRSERRIRWIYLAALSPIFVFWTNAHGGFVAGLGLVAVYFAGRWIEAFCIDRRWALKLFLPFVGVGLMVLGSTLVNPYGVELLLWLKMAMHTPPPEISEWAPPALSDPFFFPWALLVVGTVGAWLLTNKPRDLAQGAVIAFCLVESILHSRHIALFAIVVGFWMPVHIQAVVTRLRKGEPEGTTDASPGAQRWLIGALAIASVLLIGRLGMRLSDMPVERNEYPVNALQYMADEHLEGKLVCSFNWAQYAIAALQPKVQVAFDGRFNTCYPQELIDQHFDFLLGDVSGHRLRSERSGPIDPSATLRFEEPDLVLIDRRFAHSVRTMAKHEQDFVLLYQDPLAQLWGRRSKYDDPKLASYIPPSQRFESSTPLDGSVTWPALPLRTDKSLAGVNMSGKDVAAEAKPTTNQQGG